MRGLEELVSLLSLVLFRSDSRMYDSGRDKMATSAKNASISHHQSTELPVCIQKNDSIRDDIPILKILRDLSFMCAKVKLFIAMR